MGEIAVIDPKREEFNIGTLPAEAGEVYQFVKDMLVQHCTELKTQTVNILDLANQIPKNWADWDATTYQDADKVLGMVKDHQKTVDSKLDDIQKKANKIHRGIVAAGKEVKNGLPEIEINIGRNIIAFDREVERLRKEEEEHLRQEAIKREEEERLQAAIQAEKEGEKEVAEAILSESVYVPPPIAQRIAPKPSSNIVKEKWTFEVYDLMALVKAVANGQAPISAIMANNIYLGQRTVSDKSAFKIAGVRVWDEGSISRKANTGARQ